MPAAGAYPVMSLANGAVKWSDGSVTGGMSTQQGYVSSSRIPGTTVNANGYQVPNTQTTTPPPSNNGGNNGGGNNGGGLSGQQNVDWYINEFGQQVPIDKANEARKAANRARYEAALRQASAERDRAGKIKADTFADIGRFRDRSKEAFTNADQQIVDTASGQYGEGLTSFNDLQKNLYNQFAARNIGLSAQIGSLGRARENLAKQQGNVSSEKGRNQRENTLMLNERNDQAQSLENQANTQYQSAIDAATNLERLGTDQYGADEGLASAAYQNSLNDIANRAQQLALLRQQVPTTAAQYTPKFNVTDYLNSMTSPTGTTQATGFTPTTQAASVAQPTNIIDLLKKQFGLLR